MGKNVVYLGVIIALIGFSGQLALQHAMKSDARQGLYYQNWSSESLMQTVSIEDLRDEPLQSLCHLHIQPPALDTIRALLATIWASPDSYSLLRKVDQSLYVLWAMLYGILGALIFLWLSRLTRTEYALIAALFFLAHPASIFYATLLDGTILSTVLILWAYYLLWNIRENSQNSIAALTVAVLALFFTRSIFQWPVVVVFMLSLVLLKVSKRNVIIFLIVCGGLAGLYVGKQYSQFGILSTSSFSGLNLSQSLGVRVNYGAFLEQADDIAEQEQSLPRVLIRKKKLDGTPNFNNVRYLRLNEHLMHDAKKRLAAMHPGELMRSYWENLLIYFIPSSRYTAHVIVDRIPWRGVYDHLFSFPVFPGLILLSGMAWVMRAERRTYAAGTALVLPGLFVFLISVLFEKGENMRFKFFMEPVFFVFIASQLFVLGERLYRKVIAKPAP